MNFYKFRISYFYTYMTLTQYQTVESLGPLDKHLLPSPHILEQLI